MQDQEHKQPADQEERDERATQLLTQGMTGLLADTYTLYHSTQACHWNVEGPQFHSLHQMFEKQYLLLAEQLGKTRC